MKKNFEKWIKTAMVFCLGASAVLAAAPIQVKAAEQMYTITYRPGRIGTFREELIQRYDTYAKENGGSITVGRRTGNIKMQLPAGTAYPAAPRQDEIEIKEEYQGRYVINTDWMPQTGRTVSESDCYVVDYEALVNGVSYRIEFVDAQSGEQVDSPIIAQGNVGQYVTYAPAQVIDTYVLEDAQSKGMTLEEDGENILTFSYVNTDVNVVSIPGEVVTNEVTVPGDNTTIVEGVPATTPATTPAAAPDETADETQDDTTLIEEEEVPLAEAPTEEGDEDTVTVDEDEVPLGNKELDEQDTKMNTAIIIGSTIGVLAIATAAGMLIWKKKHVKK